jgi:hypothetical protein
MSVLRIPEKCSLKMQASYYEAFNLMAQISAIICCQISQKKDAIERMR